MLVSPRRVVAAVCLTSVTALGAWAGPEGVALDAGTLALTVVPARGPLDLSSGASLNLKLPDATMTAQASASVGMDKNDPNVWNKNGAHLAAKVAGPMGVALKFDGKRESALVYRDPAELGDPGTATHVVRTETTSASTSAVLPSFHGVRVTIGAKGSATRTEDTSTTLPDGANRTGIVTEGQQAYVDLTWRPLPWLGLDAGADARTADITWDRAGARRSRYSAFDPHVDVDITPWRGGAITAGVEHAVSPYDAAAFAGYASVATPAVAARFKPDHAWRLHMKMKQQVGPARLTASYTAARRGTATEFAAVNGAQAPTTTELARRDRLKVALTMPLASFGLPDTVVTSGAQWQSSSVLDPVTDAYRAASGETPQSVSIKMVHRLPDRHLKLGITGRLTSERTSYQLREISTTAAGSTLGAFIAFTPGPYEVDLKVSGLGGAATTDQFFKTSRADLSAMGTVQRAGEGPMVNFSLRKVF